MSAPSILPSIVAGLLAFTLYGVAMVLMKIGADELAAPLEAWRDPARRRKLLIWGVGMGLNFGFAACLGVALGLGHASVVSALNGFGLVVVAVLSRIVLGERLGLVQQAGMGAIIVGVALIGLFAPPLSEDPGTFNEAAVSGFLLWLSGGVAAIAVLAVVDKLRRAGAAFGAAAGALGGVAIIVQKIFVAPLFAEGLSFDTGVALLLSGWFWLWALYATASFWVLQIAYRFGGATVVAPLMVSAMILTPLVGGILVFGEAVGGGQLLGTGLIVAGVVLLTATPPAASEG